MRQPPPARHDARRVEALHQGRQLALRRRLPGLQVQHDRHERRARAWCSSSGCRRMQAERRARRRRTTAPRSPTSTRSSCRPAGPTSSTPGTCSSCACAPSSCASAATTSSRSSTAAGIGTSVHFIPLHEHSYYRDVLGRARRGRCPRATARVAAHHLAAALSRHDRRRRRARRRHPARHRAPPSPLSRDAEASRRPRSSPSSGLLVLLPFLLRGGDAHQDRQHRAGVLPPGARRPQRPARFGSSSSAPWSTGAYKMGSRLTTKRDPRVTRVGQILRWFKIDELPQLHQRAAAAR